MVGLLTVMVVRRLEFTSIWCAYAAVVSAVIYFFFAAAAQCDGQLFPELGCMKPEALITDLRMFWWPLRQRRPGTRLCLLSFLSSSFLASSLLIL